jgi:hypothetical protein
MTVSQIPSSVAERRLAVARRLYQALVAQDPNRAITLRDGGGGVVARHEPPRSEQGCPEIAQQGVRKIRSPDGSIGSDQPGLWDE